MKIILSRKGFDSAYGGYPSPIMLDGRLISLPIPSDDLTRYSDLRLGAGKTYYDLMAELITKIRYNKQWHGLNENTQCHLDPDICKNVIRRKDNWKPCFGQINQAQSHLSNEGVNNNDLFLFFGWFRRTLYKQNKLQFDSSAPDLHVIFGYLQIGDIIQVNNDCKIPDWIDCHPHTSEYRRENSTNMIYIARDKLKWNNSLSGAGALKFDESLVLTKKGFSRSKWELPDFFRDVRISRHSQNSWTKEGYFKSVDIGQEFVIEDNENVENWAKNIIEKNLA
jgi:hypothetical protein